MMYALGAGYPGSYTLLPVGAPVPQIARARAGGFIVEPLLRARWKVPAVRAGADAPGIRYPYDPPGVRRED